MSILGRFLAGCAGLAACAATLAADATSKGEMRVLGPEEKVSIKVLLGDSAKGSGIIRVIEPNFAAGAGQITFSELSLGSVNPVYQPADYGGEADSPVVRFEGYFAGQAIGNSSLCPPGAALSGCVVGMPIAPLALDPSSPDTSIRSDTSNPNSPVLSGTPTFNGPIAILFSTDQAGVGLEGGFFDSIGSTAITAFARDGSLLGSVSNEATGIEFLGLATADGSESIAGVLFSLVGAENNGFAIDNLRFAVAEEIIDSAPPIPPAAPPTAFSVGNDGRPAQGTSRRPSLSADGSVFGFDSTAANLRAVLPNGASFIDGNNNPDVFIRLPGSDSAVLVSVGDTGSPLSAGGTKASVAGAATAAAKGGSDVRVAFLAGDGQVRTFFGGLGRTRGTSTTAAGTPANAPSDNPDISAEGGHVAFDTPATNLVSGDTNQMSDVFLKDLDGGEVQRVSSAANGSNANGPSRNPSVSADGGTVFFETLATNIGPVAQSTASGGAKGGSWQICGVRNPGGLGRTAGCVAANGDIINVRTNATGEFGVFESDATNLDPVSADTNGVRDVFWFRFDGTRIFQVRRISKNASGQQANGPSRSASISDDGDQVVFESEATNLITPDTNGRADVFVKLVSTGQIQRLVTAANGEEGNGDSRAPAVSGDAKKVAFDSAASNLVPGDTNGLLDVFGVDNPTAALPLDEPSLQSVVLPAPSPPNASCPAGFFIATVEDGPGPGISNGAFGMELLLDQPGTRALAGGLNFGGLVDVSQRGFAAVNIANSRNENQRLNLSLTGNPSANPSGSFPARVIIERRSGGTAQQVFNSSVILNGTVPIQTSIVVQPGFYVASVAPEGFGAAASGGEAEGRFLFSLTTSFVDRPGGGFQGGAVVGGYHASNPFGGSSGFAAFCLATPHTVSASVLSAPSYGESGARDLRLSLLDADRNEIAASPTAAAEVTPPVRVFTNTQDFQIRDGLTVESPIVVSGISGNGPSNLRVRVEIVHTFIGDLIVEIVAPNGGVGLLHDRSGGSQQNLFQDYVVDASGVPASGTWRLRVTDTATLDEGFIDFWSLSF